MNNELDIILLRKLLDRYYDAVITEEETRTLLEMLHSDALPQQFAADKEMIVSLYSWPRQTVQREESQVRATTMLNRVERRSAFSHIVKTISIGCAACIALVIVLLAIKFEPKPEPKSVRKIAKGEEPYSVPSLKDTVVNNLILPDTHQVASNKISSNDPHAITSDTVSLKKLTQHSQVAPSPLDTVQMIAYVEQQNRIDEETVELVAEFFETLDEDFLSAKKMMDEIEESFSLPKGYYIDNPNFETETPIIQL